MRYRIDWLVFDLGGVVVDVQPAEITLDKLSRLSETPMPQLAEPLRERFTERPYSIAERFQTGELDEAGFHAALNDSLNRRLDAGTLTGELETMLQGESAEMVAFMQQLSRHHRLACYSNTNAVHWRYMQQHFRFFDVLEHAFASQEIGYAKPDPQGFAHVAAALGAPAAACLLIDDRQINVDGAQAAGWQALRFEGIDRLREDLAALGVDAST